MSRAQQDIRRERRALDDATRKWEGFYNYHIYHRPYGAVAGKTLYEALRERLQQQRQLSHEVRNATLNQAPCPPDDFFQ